jgi:hypothetical protein
MRSTGISAALRHRRLALVLWLGLVVSLLPVLAALGPLTKDFDEGPFREPLVKGWDSWGMLSWTLFKGREWTMFWPSLWLAIGLAFLVQLFLTAGAIRTLLADVSRPVLRRVVVEGAAQFRSTLWAFVRFLISLAFWEAVLVWSVRWAFKKIAGTDAPPHNGWANAAQIWTVVVGTLVYLNVAARFDLARLALAREDSPTARGAYRVAKERLTGARAGAVGLLLGWAIAGFAVQAIFTNLGIRLSPRTDAGVFWLVVFRQLGFVVLAMTRVGFWASLIRWEEARRPVPMPLTWRPPQPVVAPVASVAPEPPAEPEASTSV